MNATEIKENLTKILTEAGIHFEQFSVFPAAKKEFGDFSTNLLFKLKESGHHTSIDDLISLIKKDKWFMENFEKIEEKNGFLNFFLKNTLIYGVINEILTRKQVFGKSDYGNNKKVLIEFVSANPTGPLTIAHGRQAAFGESLARILSFCGWRVTREYYLNDCGRQMELLGISLKCRYLQLRGICAEIPEDGYHGEYLRDIAKKLPDGCENRDASFFEEIAKQEILNMIQQDLDQFNVKFDRYFSEKELRSSGRVEKVIQKLRENSLVYEHQGALWFRSTLYGDDKDRVLIKSDGSYTYLAPDIAYHEDKITRAYDLLINLWGPDHAGYIPRIKAAVAAMGFSPEKLQVIIVQLTTLYRGKEKISMSTRKGQFITLKQLMDEVGPDATKFFFLFRRADSHLDFDMELAKKKTEENPVYYIQYAYVRAIHILAFGKDRGFDENEILHADFSLLKEPQEIEILKKIQSFPVMVEHAAKTLEVSKIAHYILDLAGVFHSYYQKFRVVDEDKKMSCARLGLVQCVYIVMQNGLDLLGISKPEKM
ncbi:MAG TPA: arginine--tRNA ligase [bacterium]|nr:arginine--tRNA ligase [bacterium]HOL35683.1 arginine--tRNA ligase [bacterium]HPP07849.1 arginine--tRNA ligase [bacterium]